MFLLASLIFTSCLGSPLPSTPLPIPLENTTALNLEVTGAWYPSSPTRGTADVLYSCALTLSLCVYTAIHLNVPNPNEPKWKQSLRKAKWVSIGIIAPEVVLYTALQQWSSARGLLKALSKLTDSKLKIYRFDMTYCFFAVMGGFIVDISKLHNDYKYLTLTPQAILYLAEKGHYIVPGTSIKDKSKSDSLGKVLVCLQMTWLITQCVVRKVYGYPIFLLELHTFVHAICALLMYVLWINKPQDVCDPTIVDTSKYQDILAQGMMATIPLSPSLSPQNEKDSMNDHDEIVTEPNLGTAFDLSDVDPTPPGSNSTTIHVLTGSNTIRKVYSRNFLKNSSRKEMSSTYLCRNPDGTYCEYVRTDGQQVHTPMPLPLNLTAKDVRRLNLAFDAPLRLFPEEFLCIRSRNLHLEDDQNTIYEIHFFFIMVALMMIYGGVHLAAWNFRFPSQVEEILWKVSCLDLIVMTGFVPILLYVRKQSEGGWLSSGVIVWMLQALLALVYVFSRVFIAAEAFLSLRSVPIGVYATIPWSNLIPHV